MQPGLHLSDISGTHEVRDALSPNPRRVGPSRWRARLFSPVLGCVAVVALLMINCTEAIGGVVYATDFSSDPGWITDQADKCYWDSAANEYVVSVKNSNPGTAPSRYAYANTTFAGSSFRMEWDQTMTRSDWSAGVNFGLYSSDLRVYHVGGLTPPASTINLEYGNPDQGKGFTLWTTDSLGTSRTAWSGGGKYSVGVTYSNVVDYDAAAHTVTATVTNAGSGAMVGQVAVSGVGAFDSDMTRIGVSRHPVGLNGSLPGANPSAIASARIDNVSLSVPEPSTLVLLLIGAISLLACDWRRRRNRALV